MTLLVKWRWRILKGKDSKWLDILRARYGNIRLHIQNDFFPCGTSFISSWWKDIISLGKGNQ